MAPAIENVLSASAVSGADLTLVTGNPQSGHWLLPIFNSGYGTVRDIDHWDSDYTEDHYGAPGAGQNMIQVFRNQSDGALPVSYVFGLHDYYTTSLAVQLELSGIADPAITPIGYADSIGPNLGVTTIPAVTSVSDGSILISIAWGQHTSIVWTQPAGFTLLGQFDGAGRSTAIAYKIVPAGSTGTHSFTYSPTWKTPTMGSAIVVAPAAGGGPAPHHVRRANALNGGFAALG